MAEFDGAYVNGGAPASASDSRRTSFSAAGNAPGADEDEDLFGMLRRYHRRRGSTSHLLPNSSKWDVTPARRLRAMQGLEPRGRVRTEGARAASALEAAYAGDKLPDALAREAHTLRMSRDGANDAPSTPVSTVRLSLPEAQAKGTVSVSAEPATASDTPGVASASPRALSESGEGVHTLLGASHDRLPVMDEEDASGESGEMRPSASDPGAGADEAEGAGGDSDLDALFDTILLSQTLRYDDQRSPARADTAGRADSPGSGAVRADDGREPLPQAAKGKKGKKGRFWQRRGNRGKNKAPASSLSHVESPHASPGLSRKAPASGDVPKIVLTEASVSSSGAANGGPPSAALHGDSHSDSGSEDDAWVAAPDDGDGGGGDDQRWSRAGRGAAAQANAEHGSDGRSKDRPAPALEPEAPESDSDGEGWRASSRHFDEDGEEYLETMV